METIIYSTERGKEVPAKISGIADLVIAAAKGFHWAYKKHYQLWIYGVAPDRQSTIERALKRLEKSGKLKTFQYSKSDPKIYALPTHSRNFISSLRAHELGSTDTLVSMYRSDVICEVFGENQFRGCGVMPDWGIRYPSGKLLACEFSTSDNVNEHAVIPNKLIAYQNSFERLKDRFQARPLVLFVLDVPRDRVKALVTKWAADGQFYFVDYATFATVRLGEHLKAPVYFYSDGKEYPLR